MTMKKYIKPVMDVYETSMESMICLSKGAPQGNVNAEIPGMPDFEESTEDMTNFQW